MTIEKLHPWEDYKRPFVRDLAFALACPNILNEWINPDKNIVAPKIFVHSSTFWQRHYQNYAARLHELDTTNAYQDLTRYLMSRPSPYRLGFHFEGLMHYWLEDGHRLGLHPYQVLAHNIQLYNGAQTTGELDFILRNQNTNEIEHWELAIKFYLGAPPYHFADWVGINSRDNLERKLIHMQTRPFRSVWIDLDFYDKVKIDKRFVVMKGRFFKPSNQPFSHPEWLTNNFPTHIWHPINSRQDFEALQMPNLRPAHYIEWFTHRPFYDANFIKKASQITLNPQLDPKLNSKLNPKINKEELQRRRNRLAKWPYTPLTYEDIDTNLYMNNAEPVVLVSNGQ